MNIIITDYIFNKTAQTITFPKYSTMKLEYFKLITNVASNTIIYNFAKASTGGTLSDNVLTLDYNTTAMSDSDPLMVIYESPDEDVYDRMNYLLGSIVEHLRAPQTLSMLSTGPAQRVQTDTNSNIGTVSTVSSMNSLNGFDPRYLIISGHDTVYNTGIRNKIT